ncbi:MAG: glycosyltransferase family 4 protein, partial [Candidatus Promineifilaceae bacterium]
YKPWRMLVYLANAAHLSFEWLVPQVELYHSTEHLLFPMRHTPTILTVHDLIFKLYPEHHKRLNYWYLSLALPLFCQRATKIIAISEATKRDLVEHYGISPGKIHVIYEAADPLFMSPLPEDLARVRQKYSLPERYLLHLSTVEPRKNLDRLVDALLVLRQEYSDLNLVLVGGRGWLCDAFYRRIESEQLSSFVRALGWVEDGDLPAVIGAASAAVQPSLYEGFGLPVLEHMACGQVVAASSSSSHPEVGGDAAVYFDPESVEQMVQAIRGLLNNKEERPKRRQLGFEQAAKFSWEKAAAETMHLYDQVIGDNSSGSDA